MAKQDHSLRVTVRMPKDLHDHLQEARATTKRTLNAEILARLQKTVELESQHRDELSFVWERIHFIEEHIQELQDVYRELKAKETTDQSFG